MKYIQLISIGGECKINSIGMIEYKHPPIQKKFEISDSKIGKIFDAAIETYRQNSVDVFTDCPSRERAGWLCDSYFTSKTEFCLTGKNIIEKSFLENFLHEASYTGLPDGMLPMCYPADHNCGVHIPNWAMWLIIELKDYLKRSGDNDLIKRFKEKIFKLLKYLEKFENSDGLLESLDGWIFIEWSKANDLIYDVNYPTNMLYHAALRAASELYNEPYFLKKAENIKNIILSQSFNGEFFVDNATRKNGELISTNECTEVCQYYAFFFEIANEKTHGELLKKLLKDFGPSRDIKNTFPKIYPANAFIGNYLRLDILIKNGYYEEAIKNIKDYFGYMADKTGTLWEHTGTYASCNHGFTSYIIYLLEILSKLDRLS